MLLRVAFCDFQADNQVGERIMRKNEADHRKGVAGGTKLVEDLHREDLGRTRNIYQNGLMTIQ